LGRGVKTRAAAKRVRLIPIYEVAVPDHKNPK